MSLQDSQSPVAWRYAGDQLKRRRTKAGVSREELGVASNYAPDTIKAMEQGVRMATPKLLDVADDLFGAQGLLSAAKQYLRRERFPPRAQEFMNAESDAVSLWAYEVALVPGLLQTEEYATALIRDHWPTLSDEVVEERVRARLERQTILTRTPLVNLSFVMHEAALGSRVGGSATHRGQLLRLLEVAELRNVALQILPFDRVVSVALAGPLVLVENSAHERSGYAMGQSFSEFTPVPAHVNVLVERYGRIRTDALSVRESVTYIMGMVDQP